MMGYTLIEVLMTLSIFSILSVSGVSLVRTLVGANYQSTQVNQLISTLHYARMEAIWRGQPVILCGTSDLQSCNGDWSHGQLIRTHHQVLRVFSQRRSNEYLTWKSSFGKNDQLEFTPLGFTKGQQGSFYTDEGSGKGYRIIVIHTGSIRVEKTRNR